MFPEVTKDVPKLTNVPSFDSVYTYSTKFVTRFRNFSDTFLSKLLWIL